MGGYCCYDQDKLVLLAVAITVIAVSAITLLLILGAIITPNSIVFAKKHSNGGNNNGNNQKQKDDPNNSSNLLKTNPLMLEISLLLQMEIRQHRHHHPNYCLTHTKLWLTDSNICSDNLYLKNVQRYIAENVNLKLFPATIYNTRP
jgi:hypothetical protein